MRCDPPALYTDHYSAGVIQAPTTEHIVCRIGFDCGWGLKLISSLLIWLWASCWAVAGWLVDGELERIKLATLAWNLCASSY